jgi:hypothetical protein
MNTNFRKLLFLVVVLLLLAALPYGLRYAHQHGGLYLFSRQFLEDVPKRLRGPGRFRFVMQPAVAILLGIRAGKRDAQAGRAPYFLRILLDRENRVTLLKEGLLDLAALVAMAILLDIVSQFLILRAVYPGAALVIGPVLIAVPYAVSRALSNRWVVQRRALTHL